MKVSGTFDTQAAPGDLRGLASSPEALSAVPTLTEVEKRTDGVITATFRPVTALGPIGLTTTIVAKEVTDSTANVAVVGRRGNQVVEADIRFSFSEHGAGSTVTWESDVLLGGTIASVGQRVGAELVRRAIGEVLQAAADASAAVSTTA